MFADTDIAKDILRKRYYRDGESSPQQLLSRVAAVVAGPEKYFHKWSGEFYNIMNAGTFLPNSPCLASAGYDGGLFACFVIGIDDSLDSISGAKAQAMAITKSGGGWGIGLSSLRPVGTRVRGSTHGIAGGPIGFLTTFSADMSVMTQGGFRDAAGMATMRVDHPDILEFIEAKSPENSIIEMLNLPKFAPHPKQTARELLKDVVIAAAAETYLSNFNMSILATDHFMEMAIASEEYSTWFGEDEYERFSARDTLRRIAESAWGNGEPGLLFIDTIKNRTKYDPDSISTTNPCGEQPLPPNGSCCLGSINISNLVNSDRALDVDSLRKVVGIAVRFLDNVISINSFPTPETRDWALKNRSIGIGVMGFADALIKMGIRYDDPAATDFASTVASTIRSEAERTSKLLFAEKGTTAYEDFDGRRNNAVMSIAPTGTLSLLAGCSPGIEPIFSNKILRIDETGKHLLSHPLAKEPEFVTIKDIDWRPLVDVVAAFSQHVDTSVSYTVNLPNEATVDDVMAVYTYAWEQECNGCTVYRDQSRGRQVLNTQEPAEMSTVPVAESIKRPWALEGVTYKYPGHIGDTSTNLYVTVNDNDNEPFEVFVSTPYIKSLTELQLVSAVTRLTSLSLKYGAPVTRIVKQLKRIEGQSPASIPLLISRALEEHTDSPTGDCQECGGELIRQGGCTVCLVCGHSHCG